MKCKRGQFFLLAAVIISAFVISLGTGVNQAIVVEDPEEFYDFSYEVEREIGAYLEYGLYTDFSGSTIEVKEFVALLAEQTMNRNSEVNFAFIYGEGGAGDVTVRNYGEEDIVVEDVNIEGVSAIESEICINDVCSPIDTSYGYVERNDVSVDGNISISTDEDREVEISVPEDTWILFVAQNNNEGNIDEIIV